MYLLLLQPREECDAFSLFIDETFTFDNPPPPAYLPIADNAAQSYIVYELPAEQPQYQIVP